MRKTVIFVLVSLIVSVIGISSWKLIYRNDKTPTLIKLSLDNLVESLDPAKAYSDDSLVLSTQVLEPLYQYHYLKRPYEIQPLVAEVLPVITEDGKLVTVQIKKGIRFHSHPSLKTGRELTAHDFVVQFKRLSLESLKSPGRSLFLDLIEGFETYGKEVNENWQLFPKVSLKGVQAVDDYTLKIKLKRPEPNLIYYLALNFVSPIPWEIVEYYKNDLDEVLIGTGPYLFNGYDGSFFEMKKFKDYRLDYYPSSGDRYANVQNLLNSSKERIPFIDEVRFYITSNENDRWNKFLNREIDLLNVPKTLLPRLYDENGELSEELKQNEIQLKHFPILANRWLAFNMRDPLVGKNKNLRLAIASAVDYNKYIQVLSQNTNLRANSILVPGISGYLPAKDFHFNYNPEKAREYLKLAGFDNPATMPTIIYSTRGNQAINLLEADFIKQNLEAIGLKVKIEILTFSDFLKKGRAGELMFFTDNWLFDFPDGENIMQLLVSSNFPGINKSGYSNPKIDLLYDKLKITPNGEQKDKIYHEMEDIVFNDVPWIPLMYESSFVLQYPEIKNFRKSSIIRNYVKYLKIRK